MRVAVLDIGTNSTRLLIADVGAAGEIEEIERYSHVTRLGEGVDATGVLSEAAIARVLDTLDRYSTRITACGAQATTAVLTSAVRDAGNGAAFRDLVHERTGANAIVLPGEEEAYLTFLGAMSERDPQSLEPTLVIDVGGGSTEIVLGRGRAIDFHISLQVGVVRQTERHLRQDPPSTAELAAVSRDVRKTILRDVPEQVLHAPTSAIAVAGTATSLAAIDQGLTVYDSALVHGYVVSLDTARLLVARLASLPLAQRRKVHGLQADRAPTILAGVLTLIEVLEAFGLDSFEASEHDILRGAALRSAGLDPAGR
jgi:exopolyphosphatase/guanosine-5'-triphosphate,3'-diphosphate pyrophosphatase